MRSIWVGLFSAGCVAVGASSGCGGGVTSDTAGQGGAGSTTASSATTGTGGSGGCAAASDCSGTDTDCHARTCVHGACGVMNAPEGTPLPTQTPGDCREVVCDGQGGTTSVFDDSDVPTNAGTCTVASCMSGMPIYDQAFAGTPCTVSPGKVCDDQGNCVGCLTAADCASGVCQASTCAAPSCTDGVKNGQETGVDCGGPSCPPCITGETCLVGTDCLSLVCTGDVCQAPSCTDDVKNGQETDVDCGGDTCPPCASGKMCLTASDCASDDCVADICS